MEETPKDWKPGLAKWAIMALAVVAILSLSRLLPGTDTRTVRSYTDFKALVAGGQVESVVFRGERIEGLLRQLARAARRQPSFPMFPRPAIRRFSMRFRRRVSRFSPAPQMRDPCLSVCCHGC